MTQPNSAEKTVHMNCRAAPGCPGVRAKIVFQKTVGILAGGGTLFRYRCTTCNKSWHIRR